MEPFKNAFSAELVRLIAWHLRRRLKDFDERMFATGITARLDALELKQRAQLIADHLHLVLPAGPRRRAEVLTDMLHPDALEHVSQPSDQEGLCGWAILPLTMVVGQHGLGDFDGSLALMREMTKRFSAEFGVRYFLLADQERALATMSNWVDDPNRHVRRLVSEGTRPRLPWAMHLPRLIADPAPVLPQLERLRDDPEPYVRRSVANHLNDISKDHPKLAIELARRWIASAPPERVALLRHACRGLIKHGNVGALAVFGQSAPKVSVSPLELSSKVVRMGEMLELSAELRSQSKGTQRLTIDYVLHLLKSDGKSRPKVFKGRDLILRPGETIVFRRAHRFREVTTRRHYAGRHAVSLRINGMDTPAVEFVLENETAP